LKTPSCIIAYTLINKQWNSANFAIQLKKLSDMDQAKIKKYLDPKDRQLRILTRLLLAECLKTCFNQERISIKDLTYKNNKPFLNKKIQISFSHSGNLAVCALSTSSIIGIDAEQNVAVEEILFKEYLSPIEQRIIQDTGNKTTTFLEFWVKKEALLKAAGLGLTEIDLRSLSVDKEWVQFRNQDFFLRNICIKSDYIVYLATQEKFDIVEIKELNF